MRSHCRAGAHLPEFRGFVMLWWILIGALAAYGALLAVMFVLMCQPPTRFGRLMRHFPMRALPLVPFEPMWNVARKGTTRVGEIAPDFRLRTIDRATEVTLSQHRGHRPVVLIFGSYT
jgi:hypothetical protein